MRTDIPAFYSEWFMNRIHEGYVLVRNPYRQDWITRYELDPDVVDCIAFCTKNPAPMLKHIDELKRFHQYWFVTITPYGKDIEPNVPPKEQIMQDFITLSKAVGVNCIGWRYDPIFIDSTYTLERHISDFRLCAELFQVIPQYALSASSICTKRFYATFHMSEQSLLRSV